MNEFKKNPVSTLEPPTHNGNDAYQEVGDGLDQATPPETNTVSLDRFKLIRSYLKAPHGPMRLVRIAAREKRALEKGWPDRCISEEEIDGCFGNGENVGVVLGAVSGNLVDVDIDSEEALRVAPFFLPETGMKHGRKSNPSSHHYYIAPSQKTTKKLNGVERHTTIIELRNSSAESGFCTVIPPSVHESGEIIEWNDGKMGTPAKVEYAELEAAVHRIAGVVVLLPYWKQGSRNDLCLALSGAMAKRGMPMETAKQVIKAICSAASDSDLAERINTLDTTYEKHANKEAIVGDSWLAEHLPEKVWKKLRDYLFFGFQAALDASGVQGASSGDPLIPHNDDALVSLLISQYGDTMRFSYEADKWYLWNGKIWEEDIRKQRIQRCIDAIKRHKVQLPVSGDDQALLSHGKWLDSCLNRSKLHSVCDLATTYPELLIELNTLYQSKHLLSFENGTLNLETLELQPHCPEDYISRKVPYDYNPEAKCPRFIEFLDRIFDGNQEVIDFIQMLMGYTLLGKNPEQKVVIFYGTGANGKSKLLELMLKLLGNDLARTCSSSSFVRASMSGVKPRDDLEVLMGKRLVVASEFNENDELDESLLKQLSGEEEVTCRPLYGKYMNYTPEFMVYTGTNHRPRISGADEGIWRRICMVEFPVTIPEKERDAKLLEKLLEEAEGILAFAVEGLRRYHDHGFIVPNEVASTTQAYREEMDPIKQFLEDCVQAAKGENVRASELHNHYLTWARDAGCEEMNAANFKKKLDDKGYKNKRSNRGKIWLDIKLSDAPAPSRPGSPVEQAMDDMLDESEQPVITNLWDDSDSSFANYICDDNIPDFVYDLEGNSANSMGDDDIPDLTPPSPRPYTTDPDFDDILYGEPVSTSDYDSPFGEDEEQLF